MIGFLIKKTFYDSWDNLLKIVLLNLGFIICAMAPIFIPPLLEKVPVLGYGMLFVGIALCCVYLSTVALSLKSISDSSFLGFREFFGNIKHALPAGLVFACFVFIAWLLIDIAIPFYLFSMNSLVGIFFAAVIFWTMAIGFFSLQFFFAIHFRLNNSILKSLKKCFIVFFDNSLFCIFIFGYNALCLLISFFLAFLVPGPAGLLLFLDEAFRLRLLKYDFLEENPGAPRKKIPWDTLLIDERERTGTRSLKNFIFPWKD
ncbi:MAG: hypothetical protein LBO67_01875 [Spirochaetaceae bacterium]|nr:hypothetical protein [Spirochaetaceae bacterium]